jgi:hypothetical protein
MSENLWVETYTYMALNPYKILLNFMAAKASTHIID